MDERMIKTHLIVTDIHEEYYVDWCGSLVDKHPLFRNEKPLFVLISSTGRMELNTWDMHHIEECAKRLTEPRGRAAITRDTTRIYIKEEDGHDALIGRVIHNHIKTYAPMYDKVGYR